MTRRLHRSLAILCLVAGPGLTPALLSGQERVLLIGATLLDGTGTSALRDARIVVEGGRFTCVSGPDGCPAQPGDRTTDFRGRWISPGLIDTHVHLPLARTPDLVLRQQRLRFALGITTVRDAGSPTLDLLLAERARADAPGTPMPRLVLAARVQPETAEQLGVAIGAPMVRQLVAMGADAIKLKEPFGSGLWQDAIAGAKAAGVPVFGHTWGGTPPTNFTREAIAAGISGISHIMGIPEVAQAPGTNLVPPDSAADPYAFGKRLWITADPARLDTLIQMMVASGTWLEPTLAMEYFWGRPVMPAREVPFLPEPPGLREILTSRSAPPTTHTLAYPEVWQHQVKFVAAFARAGGMLVAGSDGIRPGVDLHEEVRLIGEAAGSPMVGLLAATRNAAMALNRADLGVIEVGRAADLVIYTEDPIGAPGATLQIAAVMKAGVLHDAAVLSAEFQREYDQRVTEAWKKRGMRGLRWLAVGAALLFLVVLGRARWRR